MVVLERVNEEMKQAAINRLIEEKNFHDAVALLKEHIKEAEIIDPRRDDSWGIDADILGYAILDNSGVAAFCSYWQDCLHFFVEELEPSWGHLHKGHIYLRLGTGYLATDLEKAAEYLREGLKEDRLFAEQRRKSDPGLEVEETVRDSPAYITLCTARILDVWSYPSKARKESFFRDLVRVKFDVIWGPQVVDSRRVERALKRFKGGNREQVLAALAELNRVFNQRLSLATMSTLAIFLWIFLRARLNKGFPSPRKMATDSLPDLLTAAHSAKVFPDPTVSAVFQMAGVLTSVFSSLPNVAFPETLTPRVLSQISVMIKILVDLAVIRWSEAL